MKPIFFPKIGGVIIGLFFLWLIILLTVISSAGTELQQRIVHIPVNSAVEGQDVVLEAKIEGAFARVIYIRIYFQNQEQESFQYVEMRQEVDHWVGHIPGREILGASVRYFLAALFEDQSIYTYPEVNPYNDPEEINIAPRSAKVPPASPVQEIPGQQPQQPLQSPIVVEDEVESTDLLLLSPEPGERLAAEDVVIAVSLIGSERTIDSSSVTIFFDGRDVTKYAKISSFLVTLSPKKLAVGRHWIKITAKDTKGVDVEALLSHFYALGEEKKASPFSQINGRVFTDLRQEKFSGKSRSINLAGGDFNGEYGALRYSGQIFITSLENKDRQPINRFSLNLSTKWAGLRLGDTNPRFNDLILWGKRVRGLEAYVHLGFFNLDVVYGETYRGVDGLVNTSVDTVMNPFTGTPYKTVSGADSIETKTYIGRYGTFRQTLLGIRPSVGSGRNFQLGLCMVKVKDDTSSISHGTMPKDNIVLGPDLVLRFDRRRFEFRATAAISALTNNIYSGAISKEDIESIFESGTEITFDPADYEKYLIINDSTVPLDPSKMTSAAYDVSVRLNYFNNLLHVGYKSIGSEYYALSNSFIRRDIQGLYFSDRLRLFKNHLYFTLRYEDFLDNFSQDDANPATDLRTLNYSLSFYPGSALPNLNISLRNRYRDNGIDTVSVSTMISGVNDTTLITNDRRENTINRDFSVQISQDFTLLNAQNSISLNYVGSDRIDRYNDTRPADSYSREVSTDVRMASLRSSFEKSLVTTIQYASNANISAGGDADFKYNMFGFSSEYKFFNSKLTSYAEFQMTTASGNTLSAAKIDYTKNLFRFGCMYTLSPMHTISLDGYIIAFKDDGISSTGVQNESFTDTIFRLRYEKRL